MDRNEVLGELRGIQSSIMDGEARLHSLAVVCRAITAIESLQSEVERRYGIGGELIAARRERDSLATKVAGLEQALWGAGIMGVLCWLPVLITNMERI